MKKRRLLIGSVVAVAALATAAHVVRAELVSRRLGREIADLQAQLGARSVPPSASAKRLAARDEFVDLLDQLVALEAPEDFARKPLEYWAPGSADTAYRADLRVRLERYVPFFDGLDRLPASLWEDRFALPNEISSGGVGPRAWGVHVATNVLCARAWIEAQEPGGAELAGRSLGRALAIRRVTDDGLLYCFSSRAVVEQLVLDAFERTRAVAFEPSDCLSGPVRTELERSLAEDRLRLGLVNEAQRFVDGLRMARASGMPAWLTSRDESDDALAYLAWYGEILDTVTGADPRESEGERCAYPRRGEGVPNHVWRTMIALDFRRRAELSAALQSI